jgi:hypothetical protein
MAGRIAFAYARGSDVDRNPKRWRILADVLNDVAMTLELIAPSFPSAFFVILCVASVARSITSVAGSSSRAGDSSAAALIII